MIDLGSGFDLLPVSSLLKNPFHAIKTIHEWRDPQARNRISLPREDWLRNDLYALFQGNRYLRVDGNVKVRARGRIRTDIDAGLFDRTSGELALFQIKWQDWSTNDVKQLRSKAKNFVEAMDTWAENVGEWCANIEPADLMRALRLPLQKGEVVTGIFLIGLSRTAARVQGYGYETKSDQLALANWPQFVRARYEVGPADNVLSRLHERLTTEMAAEVLADPIPVSMDIAGRHMIFEDLWKKVS